MPDAGVLATILLIVGLFLLALELMIPSFGIIGICAGISLLISAWCAWQAWWGTSPGFFWTYISFWLLGIPGVFVAMLWLMQSTRLGDRVVLRGPRNETQEATSPSDGLDELVGHKGEAISLLTPGGMVLVDGERHHAESRGMLIESGTEIEVIEIRGQRLVVRAVVSGENSDPRIAETVIENKEKPAEPDQTDLAKSEESAQQSDTNGNTLDFEIPENYTAG